MLFAIQHHTYYRYSQPVVFEPHFLRFKPREDSFQKLLKFRISIKPEPTGISEQIDLNGNTACQIWFNGLFQELEVQSTALIETYNTNPFNYLVYPERALNLPMEYTQDKENLLKSYITPTANSLEIIRFAEEVANEVDQQTILFLTCLTRKINREFREEYRKMGDPYPPEKTLLEKKGTCRDLAVLFMSVCREVGLAARFVSGYYFDESSKNKQDLHSWVEVYIPGGGWRGFDPSIGLATADRHIAVASSAIPHMTTPIVGTFQGRAESSLTTDIEVLSL